MQSLELYFIVSYSTRADLVECLEVLAGGPAAPAAPPLLLLALVRGVVVGEGGEGLGEGDVLGGRHGRAHRVPGLEDGVLWQCR